MKSNRGECIDTDTRAREPHHRVDFGVLDVVELDPQRRLADHVGGQVLEPAPHILEERRPESASSDADRASVRFQWVRRHQKGAAANVA